MYGREILEKEVPPLIIVTADDSFENLDATFIMDQIIPYLENHYRVMHIAGIGRGQGAGWRLCLPFSFQDS